MNTVILGFVWKHEFDYALNRIMVTGPCSDWKPTPHLFEEIETARSKDDFPRCPWSGPLVIRYINELRASGAPG